MRFEQSFPEKKPEQQSLSLNTFSVLQDTRWEDMVTETKTPRYKSTMRLGHAVVDNNVPLTLNISTVERGQNGNLQEEERDIYMIIGDLDADVISLKLSIAHKNADHPNYALVRGSIVKKENPLLENPPRPLPSGIGRELYRTALRNLYDLLTDADALPAKHILKRSLQHGNAEITAEKWYEWFGPIIEEFGYTPDPEDPDVWEKLYLPAAS